MMTVSSFLSSFLSIFLSVDPLFPLSPIFLLIEFISTCLYFRIHIFLFHLLCLFLFLIQIVTARPPFGRSVLPSRWRRWGNPISMDWREFYRMIKFSIPSLFFFCPSLEMFCLSSSSSSSLIISRLNITSSPVKIQGGDSPPMTGGGFTAFPRGPPPHLHMLGLLLDTPDLNPGISCFFSLPRPPDS